MDVTGVEIAIKSAVEIVLKTTRGIGRTAHLMQSIQDGDAVVFHHEQVIRHFKQRLIDDRPDLRSVKIILEPECSIEGLHRLLVQMRGLRHRILFDHEWLSLYMSLCVSRACDQLNNTQQSYAGQIWKEGDVQASLKSSMELNTFFQE